MERGIIIYAVSTILNAKYVSYIPGVVDLYFIESLKKSTHTKVLYEHVYVYLGLYIPKQTKEED